MKKKILCLFDYMATTGFATVTQNIIPRIKRHFPNQIELHICSINYFGETIFEEDGTVVFSAIKSATKKDDFGRFGFLKILKDSDEYDGIFIIQDLGVIVPIIEILEHIKEEKRKNNKKQFKSIFYFPVDCSLIKKQVQGIEFFDTLITYTEYGRKEVLKLRPELKGKISVIPHGTDTKNFYPIDKEEVKAFRKQYFGQNADKFIIMNLNRNQPRKDIPNTIFAFIEAKNNWHKDKPKPFLYLHCNPNDPMGHSLKAVLLQTDLEEGDDYIFPSKEEENHASPLEKLNKIYNSVDLYVTTTLGEGWGLGYTEASATMLPIICPNNTSFKEMSDNGSRAFLLDEFTPFVNSIDNIIRQQTNYMEVAESILLVSANLLGLNEELNGLELTNERTKKSYDWAINLNWDKVCILWKENFLHAYKLYK
jgi:glycosyltransferase involved in cell wall biosynthesis